MKAETGESPGFPGGGPPLKERLRQVNTLLLESRSVLACHAAIAELCHEVDERKIDVLTLGLTLPGRRYDQVRELAREILSSSYGLKDSSNAAAFLFRADGAELSRALSGQTREPFTVLLRTLQPLLEKASVKEIEGAIYEPRRRHALVILRELSMLARRLRSTGGILSHPLRDFLVRQGHQWFFAVLGQGLKSLDLFCRRRAMLMLGELGLGTFEVDGETVVGANEPDPDAVFGSLETWPKRTEEVDGPDHYLILWDTLRALTSLAEQRPQLRERYFTYVWQLFSGKWVSVTPAEISKPDALRRQLTDARNPEAIHIFSRFSREARMLLLRRNADDPAIETMAKELNRLIFGERIIEARCIPGDVHKSSPRPNSALKYEVAISNREELDRIFPWQLAWRERPRLTRFHSGRLRMYCVRALGDLVLSEISREECPPQTFGASFDALREMVAAASQGPASMIQTGRGDRARRDYRRSVIESFTAIFEHARRHPDGADVCKSVVGILLSWASSELADVRGKVTNFFRTQAAGVRSHVLQYCRDEASCTVPEAEILTAPEAMRATDAMREIEAFCGRRRHLANALGEVMQPDLGREEHGAEENAAWVAALKEARGFLAEWIQAGIRAPNGVEYRCSFQARITCYWALYAITLELKLSTWKSGHAASVHPGPDADSGHALHGDDLEQKVPAVVLLGALEEAVSAADFRDALSRLAASQQEELSLCAEMELFAYCAEMRMFERGSQGQWAFDVSERAVRIIPAWVARATSVFPISRLRRFLEALGSQYTTHGARLVRSLIFARNRFGEGFVNSALIRGLRETLNEEHCVAVRDGLRLRLETTLSQLRRDAELLRLDLLNLLRAGRNPGGKSASPSLLRQLDPTDHGLQWRLRRIREVSAHAACPELARFDHPASGTVIAALDGPSRNFFFRPLFSTSAVRGTTRVLYQRHDLNPATSFLGQHLTINEAIVRLKRLERDQEKARLVALLRPSADGISVEIGVPGLTVEVDWGEQAFSPHRAELNAVPFILGEFRVQKVTHNGVSLAAPLVKELLDAALPQGYECDGRLLVSDRPARLVHFELLGIPRTLSLGELSWRKDGVWLGHPGGAGDGGGHWDEWCRARIGQTLRFCWRDQTWSLKRGKPRPNGFVDLVANYGQREFLLVFAGIVPEDPLFEIEPGINCILPMERLIRPPAKKSATFQFIFPDASLAPGDAFRAVFRERMVNDRMEVLLEARREVGAVVSKPPQLEAGDACAVTIRSSWSHGWAEVERVGDPQPNVVFRLASVGATITEALQVGARLQAYVHSWEPAGLDEWLVNLRLRPLLPDEWDPDMTCRAAILSPITEQTKALLVRCGTAVGRLREEEMTYGHKRVLPRFARHNILPRVRLKGPVDDRKWRERRDSPCSRLTFKESADVLVKNLNLDVQASGFYYIVSKNAGELHVVKKESGLPFPINASDLNEPLPDGAVGDRLWIIREKSNEWMAKTQTFKPEVTLLPRLDCEEDWMSVDALFPVVPGNPSRWRATYVATTETNCHLFETEPGVMVQIPCPELAPADLEGLDQSIHVRLGDAFDLAVIEPWSGDEFVFVRPEAGGLEAVQFEAGPLRMVAESDAGSGGPVCVARGRVFDPPQWGLRWAKVELLEVLVRGRSEQSIPLRAGIYGYVKVESLRGESFRNLTDQILEFGFEDWPDFQGAQVEIPQLSLVATPHPASVEDALAAMVSADGQPALVWGTITNLDRRRECFRVILDPLRKFDHWTCWLHRDQVTHAVGAIPEMSIFRHRLRRTFLVQEINKSTKTINVTLKEKPFESI